jgi:hypothetical protein
MQNNVKLGVFNVSIGNAIGNASNPIVYNRNIIGVSAPQLVLAECSICHRREWGMPQKIVGKGEIHVGWKTPNGKRNDECRRKLKQFVINVLAQRR